MITNAWKSILRTSRFIGDHPLTRSNQGEALFRYLSWQLRRRFTRAPKVINFVNDSRLSIPPGAHGLTGFHYVGLPDFEDTAFMLHLLRPGDVFADVGANAGAWTMAAAAVGACVHAFEPIPSSFRLLEENVALNNLGRSVQCHAVGVGSQPSRLRFTTDHGAGNHVVPENDTNLDTATVEVPIVALDEIFGETWPSVMKIDVEGWELEVIKGMVKILNRAELLGLVIETFRHTNLHTPKLREMETILARQGFTPMTYHPFERRLEVGQYHDRLSDNTIYARDTPEIHARLRTAAAFTILGQRI